MNPSLWMGIVSTHTFLLPSYTYDLSPFLGVLNLATTPHNITITTFGVTNDNWQVSANLLLWRSSGLKVAGKPPVVVVASGTDKPVTSSCIKVQNQPLTVQGTCTVKLQKKVTASATLTAGGVQLDALSSYEVTSYTNTITYDNSKRHEDFRSTIAGKVSWSLTLASIPSRVSHSTGFNAVMRRRRVVMKPETIVTAASASYSWLLSGSTSAGSVFELSDNATIDYPWTMATLDAKVTKGAARQPTAVTYTGGTQKHYLHIRVPPAAQFTPAYGLCPVPPYETGTVALESNIHTMSWVPDVDCVSRGASAAFCYSKLLTDTTNARSATSGVCSK
jgi:hypothetical protein